MKLNLLPMATGALLAACTSNPNDVIVDLAPSVVSSLDGTLHVDALVLADRDPADGKAITISVDYTDRNGMAHMISDVAGKTDARGAYSTTLTGLQWDGTGTVTAKVSGGPTGDATFSVLDRTPPKVTIMAPATIRTTMAGTATVTATDEIGVSQLLFQITGFPNGNGCGGGGGCNGQRSLLASGSGTATGMFTIDVGNTPAGTTLTLYALAADLSGNEGVAAAATVMVVP